MSERQRIRLHLQRVPVRQIPVNALRVARDREVGRPSLPPRVIIIAECINT